MKRLFVLLVLVGLGFGGWYAWKNGMLPPWANDLVQQAIARLPASWTSAQPGNASQTPQRRNGPQRDDGPVPVVATPAKFEDVPINVDAVGTVQALNTVTVRSQVDGRLIELKFKDGQDVKAGDVLALIDPATYQAQYDQVVAKKAQDEAQLANAKIDLERYTKLAATDFGSRQQADTQRALVAQLQAQVRGDQAAIDNAKATLDYTTIRAPIDGRTGIRQVDQGNILRGTDANGIVIITQIRPIAMIFNLPQQHLRAVNQAMQRGQVPVLAIDGDGTTVLDTGTVEVVDNQVDQATGTIKIKASFLNANLQLWPGQFVNVRVQVDKLNHAITVPAAAVQRGPNGAYVYTLNQDDTVSLKTVTVGQQDERIAVIQSGIEPPARVVTTGFARLTDGAKVSASAEGQPPPAVQAPGRRDRTRPNGTAPPGDRPGRNRPQAERTQDQTTPQPAPAPSAPDQRSEAAPPATTR